MTHTRGVLAASAVDVAKDLAESRIRRAIKGYLPRPLWPLIPGEGGSVVENARAMGRRWFWGLVSSAVISLVFFAIFGAAVVGFLLVLGYALISA
jgi:hypothetical protein